MEVGYVFLWFRRLAALTEEQRPQGWATEIRKGANGLRGTTLRVSLQAKRGTHRE